VPPDEARSPSCAAAALGTTACGWAYNLGLKRTLASALPYAVAFALTPPVFVALALDTAPQPQVVVAGGLLGLCAHFSNAVKDLDADALTGVRGLPQRLGPRTSGAVSAALLVVAAVVLLPGSSPSAVSLVLAGSAAASQTEIPIVSAWEITRDSEVCPMPRRGELATRVKETTSCPLPRIVR